MSRCFLCLMLIAMRLAFLFCSVPDCRWHRRSVWHLPGELLAQTYRPTGYRPWSVSIHIILSVSLTNIFPIVRMHFGILCQQVVFALTGCHVRMCTEVRAECNVLRHMPKYGIKMIVEPELWNSLGWAWAQLSNFMFRFRKKNRISGW